METVMEKLKILADSAKYDVSCSSSGVGRHNNGRIGSAHAAGICHSWGADGRCISLSVSYTHLTLPTNSRV